MEQGRIGAVSRHVWSVAHRSHESQDECSQGCLSTMSCSGPFPWVFLHIARESSFPYPSVHCVLFSTHQVLGRRTSEAGPFSVLYRISSCAWVRQWSFPFPNTLLLINTGTSSSSREDPVESQEQDPNSNTSSEYLDLIWVNWMQILLESWSSK